MADRGIRQEAQIGTMRARIAELEAEVDRLRRRGDFITDARITVIAAERARVKTLQDELRKSRAHLVHLSRRPDLSPKQARVVFDVLQLTTPDCWPNGTTAPHAAIFAALRAAAEQEKV